MTSGYGSRDVKFPLVRRSHREADLRALAEACSDLLRMYQNEERRANDWRERAGQGRLPRKEPLNALLGEYVDLAARYGTDVS